VVVVVRGSGGPGRRQINLPWVDAQVQFRVTARLAGRELGLFSGRQLQAAEIEVALPELGQEILELAPARE
jgi:hypothetical protein